MVCGRAGRVATATAIGSVCVARSAKAPPQRQKRRQEPNTLEYPSGSTVQCCLVSLPLLGLRN
eukprot:6462069-Amphidinium_carterae.1